MSNNAPLEPMDKDSYVLNLARANAVSQVLAADDICNAQGQIIVKKGALIDRSMAERITRFKLLAPLEDSIVIDNELTTETLAECFEVFLQSDASTAWFYQTYGEARVLRELCGRVCSQPIIRQKLTVMSLVTPGVFEQAMFCAWFAYLIGIRSDGLSAPPDDLFVAGMLHDLGVIHIPADIMNKNEPLTPEETNQLHAHPVIGYNILKDMSGISKATARAVLEHHENLDGTGYPRTRAARQLSHEGQLLNLLDSTSLRYTKRYKPFDKSLAEVIPFIQISRQAQFGPLPNTFILLLRELPEFREELPDTEMAEISAAVKAHSQYIRACVKIAKHMVEEFDRDSTAVDLEPIQNTINHIAMLTAQSGIDDHAYLSWLDELSGAANSDAYRELKEAFLMMHEIIRQLNDLQGLIANYLETNAPCEQHRLLSAQATQMHDYPKPEIDERLTATWLFGI